MDILEPGRGTGRNLLSGERAEHQIDAFIQKRHNNRVASEGERLVEEAWKASERREEARRRTEGEHARLV